MKISSVYEGSTPSPAQSAGPDFRGTYVDITNSGNADK